MGIVNSRKFAVSVFAAGLIAAALGAGCRAEPPLSPTPTRTPRPPAATATPEPSATPLPTETPAPSATPTPEPVGPIGPEDYPAGVNPLTGLAVADDDVLDRAPLAIKLSNSPEARPQAGLNAADLVFEHLTEGGITRYTAVYYGQTPERVGPLRSGRLLDLELVPMLDALYVASGFSDGVLRLMRRADWVERNYSSPFGYELTPYMTRIERQRAREHTLYAHPGSLWALADGQDQNEAPDLAPGLAFHEEIPGGGEPAETLTVNYSNSQFLVEWAYDAETQRYERTLGGEPDIDELAREAVSAANVVVLVVDHRDSDIIEDAARNLPSVEIELRDSGPATLLRDGEQFAGRWLREAPEGMLQLTDARGRPLPLRPGNTWFEIVPTGFDDRVTVEP